MPLSDLTAVAAVDRVVFRYRGQAAEVEMIGMNQAGRTLVDRVGKHDKSHLPERPGPTRSVRPAASGAQNQRSSPVGLRGGVFGAGAVRTPSP